MWQLQHLTFFQETTLRGYRIPRDNDSGIMANLYSCHRDPKYFPEPDNFNPSRFINEDGNIFNTEAVIPFGLGKRLSVERLSTVYSKITHVNNLAVLVLIHFILLSCSWRNKIILQRLDFNNNLIIISFLSSHRDTNVSGKAIRKIGALPLAHSSAATLHVWVSWGSTEPYVSSW